MIWTIVETAATIIEYGIYADLMTRYLGIKNKYDPIFVSFIILILNCALTFGLNLLTPFEGLLGIIRILMNFGLALVLLDGKKSEKMFVAFITDAAVIVINFTTLNVLGFLLSKAVEDLIVERGMLRLSILFITKFVFFLFTRAVLRVKQKEDHVFAPVEWACLSLLLIGTIFVELQIFHLSFDHEGSTRSPYAIGAVVGLIFINLIVYILMRRMSRSNAEKTALIIDKMQLELYRSQLEGTEKQYQEMRSIRHDMKNHLQCIAVLIREGDYQKAGDYVDHMMQNELDFGYAGVKTGHRVIDVIANTKLSQCMKENIRITTNIGRFELEMEDIDICIILGNLFDNAIEACRDVSGDRYIVFEIAKQKGYVKILLKDPINGPVLAKDPHLVTTKKDKGLHGIGIRSVKEIVSKYGGMTDLYETDREFNAEVWIPSKKIV